jgi:hypothetical protein
MINVVVWSPIYVDIENKRYEFKSKADLVIFIKDLLDKVCFSGETICLESAEFVEKEGKALFTEIDRWSKV